MIAINLDTVAQHLFVDEVGKNRPISLNEEAQRDRLNVEETRENIRGRIAQWLVGGLLGIIFLGGVLFVWHPKDVTSEEVEKLISLVMAPVVPIVATVIGFYFGTVSGSKKTG